MGQLGYTDDDIKALGHWSSKVFEVYLKLPRTRRLEMAREIGTAEPRRANGNKRSKKAKSRKRIDSSSTDSDSSGTKELEPAEAAASHWSLLATIWPVEDRPDNLQREEVVNAIDFATLLAMAKYQESRVGAAGNGPKSSYTRIHYLAALYLKRVRTMA